MTFQSVNTVLIGESYPIRRLRALISAAAPSRLPVLIQGETGTGKELVAWLLHHLSGRSGGYVPFNVCAIGDSMFEDALFGHVRGAYTGAVNESLGFLREANGGTAFFDEISGLPMTLQAKLLRAIETGVFRPIGASRDARSDFRPVAATNEDLSALVGQNRFRADLHHRLSGILLRVPSLAERIEDIPLLATHFVRSAAGPEVSVDAAAGQLLQMTPWPGNVRELKQVVEAALVFRPGRLDREGVTAALSHRVSTRSPTQAGRQLTERQELMVALQTADWDTEVAASTLGVHRATVYRRMERHGIALPQHRSRTEPHSVPDRLSGY